MINYEVIVVNNDELEMYEDVRLKELLNQADAQWAHWVSVYESSKGPCPWIEEYLWGLYVIRTDIERELRSRSGDGWWFVTRVA